MSFDGFDSAFDATQAVAVVGWSDTGCCDTNTMDDAGLTTGGTAQQHMAVNVNAIHNDGAALLVMKSR